MALQLFYYERIIVIIVFLNSILFAQLVTSLLKYVSCIISIFYMCISASANEQQWPRCSSTWISKH